MPLHWPVKVLIYIHARIITSLVIDLEVPQKIWQPRILLRAESGTRTAFSNINIYETSRGTEFAILWTTSKQR